MPGLRAAAALTLATMVLAAPPPPAQGPHRLYACALGSREYVVGANLPPSGLFLRDPAAGWRQLGFNHPHLVTLDYDPRDPRILYIAAGNGCLRSPDAGHTWKITTGWEITEPLDISVDPHRPDHIYLALPDGIAVTRDQGRTWTRRDAGLHRKYTQTIRVDRSRAGRVLAGTEQGIFLTADGGGAWRPAGAADAMVTHLEQSPHEPRSWIATTQHHGAFLSRDGGAAWEPAAALGRAHTLYNAVYDPTLPDRLAVCGWGLGVMVSEDGGRTWTPRHEGLPSNRVWRVAFDPDHPGRLYAGVHEEALYRSDDAGVSWKRAGLEGSIIYDLVFVPERP